MSDFLSRLKSKQNFACYGSVTNEEIKDAEEKIDMRFSQEYREYVLVCGFASISGHEFTGICASKRLNVVDVTLSERMKQFQSTNNLYVVEQTNMDGVVIWQDTNGAVYQTSPGKLPIKICDSLEEYIEK